MVNVSVRVRVLVNVRDPDLVRVSKIYRTVKVQVMVNFAFDDMFGSRFTIRVKAGVRGACGVKVGTEKVIFKFSGSVYARVSVSGGVMVRVMVKVRVTVEVKVIFQVRLSVRVIGRASFRVMDRLTISFSAEFHVLVWVLGILLVFGYEFSIKENTGTLFLTQTATEHFEEAKETIPQYWFASGLGTFQYGLEFVLSLGLGLGLVSGFWSMFGFRLVLVLELGRHRGLLSIRLGLTLHVICLTAGLWYVSKSEFEKLPSILAEAFRS